jgi:hypothetical protein
VIDRIMEVGGSSGKEINAGRNLDIENLDATVRSTDYELSKTAVGMRNI